GPACWPSEISQVYRIRIRPRTPGNDFVRLVISYLCWRLFGIHKNGPALNQIFALQCTNLDVVRAVPETKEIRSRTRQNIGWRGYRGERMRRHPGIDFGQ